MDDLAQIRSQFHSTFDAELRERVDALERHLLLLEEADGATVATQAFAALYRVAYNLQGAASAVDLPDVAHLAGTLAAAFLQARAPEVQLDGMWFAAVRRAITFLSPLVAAGHAGSQPVGLFDVLADLVAPAVAQPAPLASGAATSVVTPRPAAPITAPPSTALPSTTGDPADSVRVKVGKLDALFAGTGELAVARIRIGQRLTELNALPLRLAARLAPGATAARGVTTAAHSVAGGCGIAARVRSSDALDRSNRVQSESGR